MKSISIVSIIFLLSTTGFTQTSTERIYIKGGNSAWENFMKEVYYYPSFEAGIIEYKNGKRFKSSMNYNKVLGTIQFIDEKGDTLSMSNEESINFITIGKDIFIYNPICMREMKRDGKVKLFKREMVRIADKQKIGAFGIPNTSGSIESIDRVDTRLTYNKLDINESLLLTKVSSFYLKYDKNQVVPASKKNFLNLFPKHENSIKEYIKTQNIDFGKEDDLVKLTGYLSQF